MTPCKTDVRRWYAASVALGIPWWLFVSGSLRLLVGGYAVAWVAAIVATPRVDARRRWLGVGITMGLAIALWLLLLILVGRFFGDSDSQGPP